MGIFQSTGITEDAKWNHVALVYDHGASTCRLWVNNVEVTQSGILSSMPNITEFKIGKGTSTGQYMSFTELDDFVVYKDVALDVHQINSMYMQGVESVYYTDGTQTLAPYAFWKFDKNGLLSDTSENNHHLKRTVVNIGNTSVIAQSTSNLKTADYIAFVNDPYIVLGSVETNVVDHTLDVIEGSLFSSFADIERYHVFAFDTSNVAEATLTRSNIIHFVGHGHLQTASLADGHNHLYSALTGVGNVMYTGSNIPRYSVELLNSKVHLTHAFNTLSLTGGPGNDVVQITSGGSYKSCVYAKDADGRTIGIVEAPFT